MKKDVYDDEKVSYVDKKDLKKKRPLGVTILAIIMIFGIIGQIFGLFGMYFIMNMQTGDDALNKEVMSAFTDNFFNLDTQTYIMLLMAYSVVMICAYVFCAYGFFKADKNSRYLYIVLIIISLVILIFSLKNFSVIFFVSFLWYGFLLWYIGLKPNVVEYFNK